MFTNAEMIVGLWFVPVVLCILIPLAMLCFWYIRQISKNMMQSVDEVEKAIQNNTDPVVNSSTQPSAAD